MEVMGRARSAWKERHAGNCGRTYGRLGPYQRGPDHFSRRARPSRQRTGTLGRLWAGLLCSRFVERPAETREPPCLAGLDELLDLRERRTDVSLAERHVYSARTKSG